MKTALTSPRSHRALWLLAWAALSVPSALACFGTRLRIGVPTSPPAALAAYATGYYVEEKTGIEPEFVAMPDGPASALRRAEVDLALCDAGGDGRPDGMVNLSAGDVPGLGRSELWIRREVLDDLRFTTLDRALRKLSAFFSSGSYREALPSVRSAPGQARKAARRAVADAP